MKFDLQSPTTPGNIEILNIGIEIKKLGPELRIGKLKKCIYIILKIIFTFLYFSNDISMKYLNQHLFSISDQGYKNMKQKYTFFSYNL